jgi:hypothetical protein
VTLPERILDPVGRGGRQLAARPFEVVDELVLVESFLPAQDRTVRNDDLQIDIARGRGDPPRDRRADARAERIGADDLGHIGTR